LDIYTFLYLGMTKMMAMRSSGHWNQAYRNASVTTFLPSDPVCTRKIKDTTGRPFHKLSIWITFNSENAKHKVLRDSPLSYHLICNCYWVLQFSTFLWIYPSIVVPRVQSTFKDFEIILHLLLSYLPVDVYGISLR
jgi:hypothetical protein